MLTTTPRNTDVPLSLWLQGTPLQLRIIRSLCQQKIQEHENGESDERTKADGARPGKKD